MDVNCCGVRVGGNGDGIEFLCCCWDDGGGGGGVLLVLLVRAENDGIIYNIYVYVCIYLYIIICFYACTLRYTIRVTP